MKVLCIAAYTYTPSKTIRERPPNMTNTIVIPVTLQYLLNNCNTCYFETNKWGLSGLLAHPESNVFSCEAEGFLIVIFFLSEGLLKLMQASQNK